VGWGGLSWYMSDLNKMRFNLPSQSLSTGEGYTKRCAFIEEVIAAYRKGINVAPGKVIA
jgi:hypothetical protein